MNGAFRQAAHPEQPLFQLVQISLKMTFHLLHPLCKLIAGGICQLKPALKNRSTRSVMHIHRIEHAKYLWQSIPRRSTAAQTHPKRPVMYASVLGSEGVVNICPVGENSIRSPFSMNAVESLTRAACCML